MDTWTGTAGNDTFNAIGATFLSALDTLDGGSGTDTLNVTDTVALTVPASVSVKNIESATISDAAGVIADVSGWTGLTSLTIASSTGVDTIVAANTTTVNITDTAGAVTTTGGSTVKVTTATGGASQIKVNSGATGAVTAVTTTGGNTILITDANTIAMDGTVASYAGGSGVDIVTLKVAPTKTIDGGAGTADVLVVNAASFSLTKATGFETLGAGALATGAYSAAGFTGITEGLVAGSVSWTTVAAGTGLTITAGQSNAYTTDYTLATDTAADTANVTLTSANAITVNKLTLTNVETINLTVTDTETNKHQDTLTLASGTANANTIKVTGNAGLILTDADLNITSLDASGVTNTAGTSGTGVTFTSGILNKAAITVLGSVSGGDIFNFAAATKAVTITETAGVNAITGSATIASTLTGGTGVDTIVGGAGNDTIVGGGGADQITGGLGADKITLSGTTSKIINTALLDSGANTSTSIQTAELTSTFDVVTGAAAGDTIQLKTFTAGLTATNSANLAGADDLVVFARGTYDSTAGTFTYNAAGADTAMTYDTTVGVGTAYETILRVGFVQGATTAISGGGLITLA